MIKMASDGDENRVNIKTAGLCSSTEAHFVFVCFGVFWTVVNVQTC